MNELLRGCCVAVLGFLAALSPGPLIAATFLTPEEAFKVEAKQTKPGFVEVRLTVAKGYALYRARTQVSAVGDDAKIAKVNSPDTADEHYRGLTILTVEMSGMTTALLVKVQGCADAGLCYPPVERRLELR
ncbi:protein-disulfide reductase DsbD domain-containing protein [Rhodoferax sp.]|uniref:protein-disulfide reductase DsbD domain-containing protein n=1 Tax=Rhodoferax sp. TaxID=50421 RepID=UPI002754787A|nr:protein-disulfide reductase DsbD family protein [Rhodoferax sp.]